MKIAKVIIAALAALASLPLAAQQPATPQATDSANTASTPAANTAPAAAAVDVAQMRPVTGELEGKIDSKSAKTGDSVVIKTTENATTAGGTMIPKGSKIMGHVTDVQAHDKTNPNGKVTLQFDQAELKGGKTIAVRTVIQSVALPNGEGAANQEDAFGTGAPGAMGGAAAAAPNGGSGGSGGMAPGAPASARNTPMQTQAGAEAVTPGGYTPPAAGTVVAQNGNVSIRTTSVPNVLLAENANGQPFSNASGALLSAKQNVHLDGGTQVVLAVVEAGGKNNR